MPPFHFPNPGRGSGGEAPSRPGVLGVSPGENFCNCVCDLLYFVAVWWPLFVGRRTRYICNFAININLKPICQLRCPRDCIQCFYAVSWAVGSGGVLAWPSVWSEVQTCIWPSLCHYPFLRTICFGTVRGIHRVTVT